MVSPASAAPNGGASASNASNAPLIVGNTSSKAPPQKPSAATRRQSGSPMDGAQRHPPSQKAWTSTNPMTQRSPAYTQQNGTPTQPRNSLPAKNASSAMKETNTPDKHANDRLMFLLANVIGLSASVTTKSGDNFEGIFSGSSFEPNETAFILKMAKQTKHGSSTQANGVGETLVEYVGSGQEHVMAFEMKDVVHLQTANISLHESPTKSTNGASSAFRTDADISGNLALRERTLKRWEPSSGPDADMNTDTFGETAAQGSGRPWDQFAENEKKFGVKSDYDENIYTTTIDRSNPLYKQRAAAAERIAREIESGTAMNSHVAEERGLVMGDDSGIDEEEKYSGVRRTPSDLSNLRSGQGNKYTPPARRAPTSKATVQGAPVDPAIISSQIARSESPAKPATTPSEGEKGLSPTMSAQKGEEPSTSTVKTIKGLAEPSQRSSAAASSTSQSGAVSPNAKKVGESATTNVENEVRDAFKQFASQEKMRVHERRRNQAKADKDIKLNDLMKFSQNFKLLTPVPKDLVSILAKDKLRQEEIVEKARRNADDLKKSGESPGAKAVGALVDQKPSRPSGAVARYEPGPSSASQQESSSGPRGPSKPYATMGSQSAQPSRQSHAQLPRRQAPGLLGERLANMHQQSKANPNLIATPSPVPLRAPTGPAAISTDLVPPPKIGGTPTPSSATSTKFNVKALEFKPNPAAVSFTPTGNPSGASSPRSNGNARPASRVATPSSFFGSKKPLPATERPQLDDNFNSIKRLRKEATGRKEDWASHGGIQPAHKTGPRWDVADENKEKTYTEVFEKAGFSNNPTSSPPPPHANPQMPHQHQLPFHLQHNGGPAQPHTPHQPHHMHPQQHHPHPGGYHQYDDHRMHNSSQSPSVAPSPRLQQMHLAYQSPMGQPAQLMYPPMPAYGMGPGGPPMSQYGRFPPGPHMMSHQGSQSGAPMMAHTPSNGPYMGIPQVPYNPQMQMYSPGQGHAFPQHGAPPPPPPGSNGYPSPGRGAPPMMHQGSQQGHSQQMMMYAVSPGQHHQQAYAQHQNNQGHLRGGYQPQQQHFGSSPHQPHHMQHHRGAPSGNYGHGGPPQPAVPQGPPTGPAAQSRGSDATDDAK
ncbi:MAG: Bud site selection protein 6 [Chaenotheca gracillima]|nr:MAG: Bud site selection protein 6 [Chaenotheca gracillima]